MIVVTTRNFDKAFSTLPRNIREFAFEKLEIFNIDPFSRILRNHQLQGSFRQYRSINVTGDYRIIYEQYNDSTVRLIDIGTHSQLFGK